jgi:hypothetical protein
MAWHYCSQATICMRVHFLLRIKKMASHYLFFSCWSTQNFVNCYQWLKYMSSNEIASALSLDSYHAYLTYAERTTDFVDDCVRLNHVWFSRHCHSFQQNTIYTYEHFLSHLLRILSLDQWNVKVWRILITTHLQFTQSLEALFHGGNNNFFSYDRILVTQHSYKWFVLLSILA